MGLRRFVSVFLFLVIGVTTVSSAQAAITEYRWTQQLGMSDSLQQILVALNRESNLALTYSDFRTFEPSRNLARYRFTTHLQLFNGVPIAGAMVRTWSDLQTGHLVQMEAHLDDGVQNQARQRVVKRFAATKALAAQLKALPVMKYVREVVGQHRDDRAILKITDRDQWSNNDLQKIIEVTGRRGTHKIVVSHLSGEILSTSYTEFPQADHHHAEIDALVYPIYEESEKNRILQERVPVKLKNLEAFRKESAQDPYALLRKRHFFEDMMDPVKGETAAGQAAGYWSLAWLLRATSAAFDILLSVKNDFANKGQLLVGKYATVNLHPEVTKFSGIKFPLAYSGRVNYLWKSTLVDGLEKWEVVPASAYYGLPLLDAGSALARPATRAPDHDPVTYINEGFDEIQVYYAIDQWMESLHKMGFSDPELSTRPFHAFLYDPDIGMRDNAYYTNDTINFTTYSPDAQNYARDNSTIWHELGHGVMDRLMGEGIVLADTGGLSEGMADFLAQLVVQDVTNGQPFEGSGDFRIINRTGFHLTNEVHDDGEAYGGVMKDILDLALQKFGRSGLAMMTDLTLDAMRLTRNHPGLTASGWFEHMLFADDLGHAGVRPSGAMRPLILEALASRNFVFGAAPVANFKIVVSSDMGVNILTSVGAGSRNRPIFHELKKNEEANYDLSMELVNSPTYQFKFPVTVEVNFNGGPLQGAVKWKNEAAGPLKVVVKNSADVARVSLAGVPGCDTVNRDDGTCVDYAYIKVYNAGEVTPVAKKRFYLRIK